MNSKLEKSKLERLQARLGYTFLKPELLVMALTHRSHGTRNNERLEFLGDSILSLVIAEDLFARFDQAREGELTRLRSNMVRRQTLAEIAREFELGDYLIMGSGEMKSGGFRRDSILSNALEAIIGAVFVDADIEVVRQRVITWFSNRLEKLSLNQSLKDAKSKLQELLQARQAALPRYQVLETRGQSHAQIFYVQCESELLETPVTGEGSSRRVAEQNAASLALVQLGVEHDK